jgi:hypothetical protein
MRLVLAIVLALSLSACGTVKTIYDLQRCGGSGNCG